LGRQIRFQEPTMTVWQAIVLGLIQGITEFLPISSSAHLALAPYWLGWRMNPTEAFVFDVLVQVATLVAVIGYYRGPLTRILRAALQDVRHRRLGTPDTRLGLFLVLGTVPGALAGLVLKDAISATFQRPGVVAAFLVGTAVLLALAELLGRRTRDLYHMTMRDALTIGSFQALALFPGISRSGATISAGMLRHLKREDAAHFSFLLAVPIMLGAGAVALLDLLRLPWPEIVRVLPPLFLGSLTALISGYVVIHTLLTFLRKHSLWVFSLYCLAVALLTWWRF